MSESLGTYSFLPWVRRGIANELTTPAEGARARVDVKLDIEGDTLGGGTSIETVERSVELYGPGDIVGIQGQISRLEPQHWVTNFEPNYFPAVEFYDEDFPWRYTPAPADNRRLLPWLTLVVLEEGVEFEETAEVPGRPLSAIKLLVDFADVFPEASEAWAWAHAHFNSSFSDAVVETNASKVAAEAQKVIDTKPDSACSRLLCGRKLKPSTAYHAFLLPAFESGRLAGLNEDAAPLYADAANGLTATSSSWGAYGSPGNRPQPAHFPFYHRWYFRTAERGDFESLVRELRPTPVDGRVGHRDIDVTDPAPNIIGINDPELAGVLRLGGALQAPAKVRSQEEQDEFLAYENWASPYPQPFQTQLAAFVNLADAYQNEGSVANTNPELDDSINGDPDPLITPPIYGRWHALTERLLTERDGTDVDHPTNWVHDLNLDPRWRAAAGFGTEVVQDEQEQLMESAWDQVGDVLEANHRIRQAQVAMLAGYAIHQMHVVSATVIAPGLLLSMAAPVKTRMMSSGLTVHHQMKQSAGHLATTSAVMRRSLRPRSRAARFLKLSGAVAMAEIVDRTNREEISAAPPRELPKDLLTPDRVADAVQPNEPGDAAWVSFAQWVKSNLIWLLLALVVLLVLLSLILGSFVAGLLVVGLLVAALFWSLSKAKPIVGRQDAADRMREENMTLESVDARPSAPDFELQPEVEPGEAPAVKLARPGDADNPTAARFRDSLRDQYRVIEASRELGKKPDYKPLDLALIAADLALQLNPKVTVPRWTMAGIELPGRIQDQMGERFVEAMAYPEIDRPMYEPLAKAGPDKFVPNLHLVENNSVTLLETNQKFIEAYMVGLNHEFARELLWREYPTDQRGSYFRQFWDVRKKIAQAADPVAAREALKDIKPLHLWSQTNDLGDHDNREAGVEAEEELVLVIRGELLKKYPNTVISAQPAKWVQKDGSPDKSVARQIDDSVEPITPLYEARVAPDIYFFGFDLTALEARGNDDVDDKPGWFFRIEEVPGDARFGFDLSREAGSEINVWNDLAWSDVVPALVDGKPVRIADIPVQTLIEPPLETGAKHEQWLADKDVTLNPTDASAAELAYVSLQTPVLMAIHASELLTDD